MCQHFRQRHGIVIEITDISLQIQLTFKLYKLFPQLANLSMNPGRLFRLKRLAKYLFLVFCFRFQLFYSFSDLRIVQHKFRGRKYRHALQFFNGTLA